jgi:hypothetical protein
MRNIEQLSRGQSAGDGKIIRREHLEGMRGG